MRDLFESQTLVDSAGERGRIRVVEAADVRNLDVPYLFLMGLSEASFPLRGGTIVSTARPNVASFCGRIVRARSLRRRSRTKCCSFTRSSRGHGAASR